MQIFFNGLDPMNRPKKNLNALLYLMLCRTATWSAAVKLGTVFPLVVAASCGPGLDALRDQSDDESALMTRSYANTPGDMTSTVFSMTAGGESIRVIESVQKGTVHYARFSASGKVDFSITAPDTITSHTIHPKSKNIPSVVNGKTLTFSYDTQPGYFVIEINALEKLLIFMDPLETNPPKANDTNVVRTSKYVTDLTGSTLVTSEILQAANEVRRDATKNVLFFDNGTYLIEHLIFENFDNMTIYLDDGVLLKHVSTYNPDSFEPTSPNSAAMFMLRNCSNVALKGRGVLDFQGYEYVHLNRNPLGPPYFQTLQILSSNDIKVRGITLRNGRGFQTYVYRATNFLMDNTKALSVKRHNTDGFHVRAGDGIVFRNSFTFGGDDSLPLSSEHAGPINEVLYDNNFGWIDGGESGSFGNPIRIGYGHFDDLISNIKIKNSDFYRGGSGGAPKNILIHPQHGGRYENIEISDSHFDGNVATANVSLSPGEAIGGEFLLANLTFSRALLSQILGRDESAPVERLTIKNWSMAGRRRVGFSDAQITTHNVKTASFDAPELKPHDSPKSTWSASLDFGGTQGENQWSYQEYGGAYHDMTWRAGNSTWKGNATYSLVWAGGQHPDGGRWSVRKWVCPPGYSNAAFSIKGTASHKSLEGDGVRVRILKNGTVIWGEHTIKNSSQSHNLEEVLNSGDAVYFQVHQNGTASHDATGWSPSIVPR